MAGGAEWEQNFQQCLELLRGPGDERRFVGLLLVTRLLPHGSDSAVRAVVDALGLTFLQRLLLPLRPPSQLRSGPVDPESLQQQATGCGLGLAILAAACRLPEVAQGREVRELVPVLLQVVHYGGVSPILLLHNHQQPGALDDTTATALFASAGEADGSALVDALECLLAASAAPSFDAPAAAGDALVQGGAMEALAACLQRLADALTATPPPSVGGAGYQQQHNAALLAMALLERLLTGAAPAGRRADVLGQRPGAVATVATALAALVGSPRLLRPCPGRDAPAEGATSSAASGSGAQAASSSSAAAAAGAGGGAGGGAAAAAGAGGAAQLQLESLHVLLVLLRECQAPGAESALYGLQLQGLGTEAQPGIRGLAGAEPWAVAVRRGLGWLLRSRAPVALRHMALQLAAVTVQLVGEGWLLGAGAEWQGQARAQGKGRGQGKEAAGERPGEFLVLLLEVLRIETGLLLHDALHPTRAVPREAGRRAAAGQRAAPQPSQRLLRELRERAAAQREREERAVRAALEQQGQALGQQQGQLPAGGAGDAGAGGTGEAGGDAEGRGEMEVEAGAGGTEEAGVAGEGEREGVETELAGARALEHLPACFLLMEAAVGALAVDAAAADGEAAAAVAGVAGMGLGDSGGQGAAAEWQQPVLSDTVMQRLMHSLDAACDGLLQFFEAAAEQQQQQQQQEGQRSQQEQAGEQGIDAQGLTAVVALGAARALGRYFAEAPGAVRSERVLKALPLVMGVGTEGAQVGAPQPPASGLEQEQGGSSVVEPRPLEEFALTFLLPGLIQATGPGAEDRASTQRALRSSAAAVAACVSYLAHAARAAAEAAARLQRLQPQGQPGQPAAAGAAAAAASAEVLRAERAVADCCALLLSVVGEPAALAKLAARKAPQQQAAGAAPDALPPAWGVLRQWLSGPTRGSAAAPSAPTLGPADIDSAAAAAAQRLPPALAQVLPAVWALQLWGAARGSLLQALQDCDVLAPARAQGQSQGQSALTLMARGRLAPRALLCGACLASVLSATVLRYLADRTEQQQQQQEQSNAAAAEAEAALAAVLPAGVTNGVCELTLAAAAAGAALELWQLSGGGTGGSDDDDTAMGEAAGRQGRPAGRAQGDMAALGIEGGAGGEGSLSVQQVVDDYVGDGETCWGRLLGACVQLVEVWGPMRGLALRQVWVQRAVAAAGAGGGRGGGGIAAAVGEEGRALLMDVNLALLVQVLSATA